MYNEQNIYNFTIYKSNVISVCIVLWNGVLYSMRYEVAMNK